MFANLSDRFVTQNGVMLIGLGGLIMMLVTRGAVAMLVVLYSINVFITFSLSQLGMVRHWWLQRHTEPRWRSRIAINGIGLMLTTFILISLSAVKFHEGGWVTLLLTGALIAAAFSIKRHYRNVTAKLGRLDEIVRVSETEPLTATPATTLDVQPAAKTAVLFVNGFNGLGLHTLLHATRFLAVSSKILSLSRWA